MNTENYNRFDELIRQKLDSYEAEPDMDLLVNIHARKNRFLRSRNLLTIIALLAILMAGILGGYLINSVMDKRSLRESDTDGISMNENGTKAPDAAHHAASGQPAVQAPAGFSGFEPGAVSSPGHSSDGRYLFTGYVNKQGMQQSGRQQKRHGNTGNKTLSDVIITTGKTGAARQQDTALNPEPAHPGREDGKQQETDQCSVSFEYYTNYDHSLHFMANAATGSTLKWQFGDGQTSSELNPNHRYQKPGEYAVTLTSVNPATNCRSEVYKLVRITKGIELTSTSIQGTVFADAGYASKTMVQLIEFNSRYNTGKVVQTTFTNSRGHYAFDEVQAGNYVVLSGPYREYASTYYGNTVNSEAATNITVFRDDYKVLSGYDIQLSSYREQPGSAANEPDPGSKQVIVFDENNLPVAIVTVNSSGQIIASSSDLPSGTYNLVDPESGDSKGQLRVDADGNKSMAPGSGSMTTPAGEVRLSPNPASSSVNVGLTNGANSPAQVTIINYSGSVVKQFTVQDGSTLNNVDINSLSGGTYYVIVKQNGITATSTLIKASDNAK